MLATRERTSSITIIERRPPWSELAGLEWTSMKIVQHAARRGGPPGGVRPRDDGWRASLDTPHPRAGD
jgi:hypothetical protein